MAKQITLDSVVVRSEELVASEVEGETVMMSMTRGNYYGLDAIGTRIWCRIDVPCAVSDLCATLIKKFEVTADQCRSDVLAFLNEMAEEDLVKVVNDRSR